MFARILKSTAATNAYHQLPNNSEPARKVVEGKIYYLVSNLIFEVPYVRISVHVARHTTFR